MNESADSEQDIWFRFAVELTPDATIVVDRSGIIRLANAQAEALFGYPRPELIGMVVDALVPEHVRAGHAALRDGFFANATVRQMTSSIDVMAQRKSGDLLPVSIGLSPLETPTRDLFVMASIRDNTALHEAHAAAASRAKELSNITETASDAIVIINANSEIVSWNAATTRIFGHAEDDAIGSHISLIIPQQYLQAHAEGIARVVGGGEGKILGKMVEVEGLRRGGETFPIELSVSTWMGEDGRMFSGILRDITDRKKAEQQVEAQRSQLQDILTNVRQGVVLFDKDQRLAAWNTRYRHILRIDYGVLEPGMPLYDLLLMIAERGDYGEGDPAELARKRVAKLWAEDYRADVAFADDLSYDVHSHLTPNGGLLITYTDITDRKASEKKLKSAYDVISTSIDYASNIQRSLLPREAFLAEDLADHFILWEPRDVVGGDLYWYRRCRGGFVVILADCTGHGVPGAFMTMLSTGALDRSLRDHPDGDPAELLGLMNRSIKHFLGQDQQEGHSDDGLELGICRVDASERTMVFAGARFSLFRANDGGVTEIKGDKSGIGYRHVPADRLFTNHDVALANGDTFYMTTDGLTDQIGGETRRAFGKRRFTELVGSVHALPMAEQKDRIVAALTGYQGAETRRDDVSVIGFRV